MGMRGMWAPRGRAGAPPPPPRRPAQARHFRRPPHAIVSLHQWPACRFHVFVGPSTKISSIDYQNDLFLAIFISNRRTLLLLKTLDDFTADTLFLDSKSSWTSLPSRFSVKRFMNLMTHQVFCKAMSLRYALECANTKQGERQQKPDRPIWPRNQVTFGPDPVYITRFALISSDIIWIRRCNSIRCRFTLATRHCGRSEKLGTTR